MKGDVGRKLDTGKQHRVEVFHGVLRLVFLKVDEVCGIDRLGGPESRGFQAEGHGYPAFDLQQPGHFGAYLHQASQRFGIHFLHLLQPAGHQLNRLVHLPHTRLSMDIVAVTPPSISASRIIDKVGSISRLRRSSASVRKIAPRCG